MAQAGADSCCPAQITAGRLRWLPQISGSGAVFARNVPLSDGKERGMRLTLDVLWPLYDGGLARREGDQAEAALVTARAAAEAQG